MRATNYYYLTKFSPLFFLQSFFFFSECMKGGLCETSA